MINQEEVFQAVQKEDWKFLVGVLHKNKADISSDALLTLAAKTFVTEFLSKVDSHPLSDKSIVEHLEMLWLIDSGKFYELGEQEKEKLVSQIIARKQDVPAEAYNYAKMCSNSEAAKEFIRKYEKALPKPIEHTQLNRISVTETNEVLDVDYTINLFKSNQEAEFFYALKRTFDSYQIYPNVAISCLLNWGAIKKSLSHEEKDYFFKGIVDFVVFDQAIGFKPIYFFELDSHFHDLDEVKAKDGLKDAIFAKAGVKIKRIRKQDRNVSEQEFIKLLRDLIKQDSN
jgi:hypothetical protein